MISLWISQPSESTQLLIVAAVGVFGVLCIGLAIVIDLLKDFWQ